MSLIVALLSACGGSGNGELIGVQNRQIWNPTDPYGMVFIPQGSFIMGPSDQDVPFANVSQSKLSLTIIDPSTKLFDIIFFKVSTYICIYVKTR